MDETDRTAPWTLRYRNEAAGRWQHTGLDLEVGVGGSVVVFDGCRPEGRAIAERRARQVAERVVGSGCELRPGDVVVAFDFKKQLVDMFAALALLIRPCADGFEFRSMVTADTWETWWESIIADEARLVAAGLDVPDGEPPNEATGASVTLVDALSHPVDSKELAWRIATRWAMRYGLRNIELRS